MIVVDNALISYLMIPGDHTEQAEQVRAIDSDWIAPPLWISEFRNVLRKYMVGGYLSVERALAYVDLAEQMMQGRSHVVSSAEVLALVAASGCTAYDCEYVALARAAKVPLVTTVSEVLRAFPSIAVHPGDFRR